MKKINLLYVFVLLFVMGFAQKSFALTEEEIDWTAHCQNLSSVITTSGGTTTFVYLYNTTQKKFLTVGGTYGVQGILANVGMRFYITSNGDNTYTIYSRIDNNAQGKCLALEGTYQNDNNIFLDRSAESQARSSWTFTSSSDNKSYTISYHNNYTTYIGYNSTGYLEGTSEESNASNWLIVTEEDYRNVIRGLNETYIDVTGLLYDSRFERNNADVTSWDWITASDNHSIGLSATVGDKNHDKLALDKGAYYAAEIDDESNTLKQTISGLPAGLYKVTCQGFYYSTGNKENSCAYIYANNNKTLLQTITGNGKSSYEGIKKTNYDTYYSNTSYGDYTNLLKDNIAAGEFLNPNKYISVGNTYVNEVYVYVNNGTLDFGIDKTSADGQAFFDNFKLYYCGKQEIYINEEGTTKIIDHNEYKFPCRLNYRRAFTLGNWNAIVLPVNLTGAQVKSAFGKDAKLSILYGIDPNRSSQILFKTVDLNKEGIALEAGKCYVIYVTDGPDVEKNSTYTYSYNNTLYTIHGPLYQIEGVTQEAYTNNEVSYDTADGKLTFTGYYYKTYTNPNGYTNNYSYFVNDGNMYYNTQNFPIYATRWTLKDKDNTGIGAKYTFNFDGISEGNGTTAIENINTDTSTNAATSNTVYNLNGQVVRTNSTSLEGLAKGIYIVNGKKYIVK